MLKENCLPYSIAQRLKKCGCHHDEKCSHEYFSPPFNDLSVSQPHLIYFFLISPRIEIQYIQGTIPDAYLYHYSEKKAVQYQLKYDH